MEKETFEDYLQRVKDRRTENDYKYTDEDLIKERDKAIQDVINGEIIKKLKGEDNDLV